jgi:hypothetical protein
MKSKISKAQRTIVHNTLERWVHNLTEGNPDPHKAEEYLKAGYKNGLGSYRRDHYKNVGVNFHVVASPIAFMIAVTVARGRMSKRNAQGLCKELGIESGFLRDIHRDSLLKWNPDTNRWRQEVNNEFTRTWLRSIREEYLSDEQLVATINGRVRRWWRNRNDVSENSVQLAYRTNDLTQNISILRSMLNDAIGLEQVNHTSRGWDGRQNTFKRAIAESRQNELANQIIWDSNTTRGSIGELRRAIDITDLMRQQQNDNFAPEVWLGSVPKAVDAEILCRILKIDNPAMTWEHEVFHHCTAFAAFQRSCIVLAARPQLSMNDEGNLHSTTGPAVSWADGTRLWFNDGHYLNECGKRIVAEPEKLSTAHILEINNEETRRVAIEKFGWDRFIAEANCPVIDRRVNDIDNTIEMLVGAPRSDEGPQLRQNRMVLFCRSTGRRYFLGVPRNIESCEAAQTWMSDSGSNPLIPYSAMPMRLVGAS